MDLISNLSRTFHLNARVSIRARFCGHWSLEHPAATGASFHLVVAGQCWVHWCHDENPTLLRSGDLVILPRDASHRLSDSAIRADAGPPHARPLAAAEAGGTGVVCGHFRFDGGATNPLLDVFPDVLIIHTNESVQGSALRRVVELLVTEAQHEEPGFEAVADRLSDVLFIEALRWYLNANPDQTGLAAAVADPAIHRALEIIHDRAERPGTLSELASSVAMSRSSFVKRFRELLGESPMAYITRWRMQCAFRWLREGAPVAAVADRCGYATEAGFSKAFKRFFDVGPGAVRRQGRDTETHTGT